MPSSSLATRASFTAIVTVAATALATIGIAAPAGAAGVPATPNASWSPWKACPGNAKQNCAVVRAITRTPSGVVFLGGNFTQLRSPDGRTSIPVSNLAAIDDSGSPVTTFQTHAFNGTVFTLATDGTSVYAGGAFSKVDGRGTLHVARFAVADGGSQAFRSGVNGTVYASLLANGKLYLGGKFDQVQGAARGNLAAVDPVTGTVDPSWTPQATLIAGDAYPNNAEHNNIPIRALAAPDDGSRIYVAGDMDILNGRNQPVIGAVDPATGATDPSFFANWSISKYYQGMSIAVVSASSGLTPGIILAAGGLSNTAWRLNTNGSIVWRVNSSGDVQAAAVQGSTVYLGGHFDCISVGSCFDGNRGDDIPRIHLAAFDYNGSGNLAPDPTWAPALGPTWNPYYYGVWALQVYGSSLYVGGVFKNVVVDGTTYNDAKYARFGPAAVPLPPPPPPPAGSTLFSDDFASGTAAAWNGVGKGMTIANGVATGATPGLIAYLGRTLPAAQTSLDYSVRINATSLDPTSRVVLMRLAGSVGSAVGSTPTGVLDVFVKPDGTLGVRNETTKVNYATTGQLGAGSWHTLGLSTAINGTASTVQLSLDGTPVLALPATINLVADSIDTVQIGDTTKHAYTISWDDVVVKSGG